MLLMLSQSSPMRSHCQPTQLPSSPHWLLADWPSLHWRQWTVRSTWPNTRSILKQDPTSCSPIPRLRLRQTAITLVYSREYLIQRHMYRGEFFALVLFAVAGMMIMVSGAHFLSIYGSLPLLGSFCIFGALVAADSLSYLVSIK